MSQRIVAIIGGGSVWTPHLLTLLAEFFRDRELQIRLQGPTVSHLQEVAAFVDRITGNVLDVQVANDLEDALSGASVIVNQVRVGGWQGRLKDEVVPVQHGIVGDESLGLGGVCAAIRTWPFVVEAASIIQQRAPAAWLLNLTNPSDLVSSAWRHAGCDRVISLCDYPQTVSREYALLAGDPELANRFEIMSITHVGWLIPPYEARLDRLVHSRPSLTSWIEQWKALPTPWRIRMSDPEALVTQQIHKPGDRARQLGNLVSRLRTAIRHQTGKEYERLLLKRFPSWYDEMVVPALRALLGGPMARLVVGLPNDTRLPELDPHLQLEGWGRLGEHGVILEATPMNSPCREDLIQFGQSRWHAFTAMLEPRPELLNRFVRSDPFTGPLANDFDWSKLMDLDASMGIPNQANKPQQNGCQS